jgi:hypothetical protein
VCTNAQQSETRQTSIKQTDRPAPEFHASLGDSRTEARKLSFGLRDSIVFP